MKALFVTVLLAIASLLLGQSPYETAMNSAMEKWESAQSPAELTAVANQFDRIAAKETDNWEPLYYSILVRSVQGFMLPKDEAFKSIEKIEMDYDRLTKLMDNDETKVLKGLYLTVKVAKDPMTYGATLSEEITNLYAAALKENPENPRAMFHLAEYNMQGAQFWGQDPKSFCPQIAKSIELFKAEEKDGYQPTWGQARAEQVYAASCAE